MSNSERCMVYGLTKQTGKNARELCLDFCSVQDMSDNTGNCQANLINII